MADFPNVYSTTFLVGVNSTAGTVASFGFNSKFVRIQNLGAVDLFINVQNSSGISSTTGTGQFCISSCAASWTCLDLFAPISLAGVGVISTSTGAGGQRVAILALA